MATNAQLSADFTSSIGTTTNGSSSVNIYSQTAFHGSADAGQTVTFDIVGIDFDNDEVATAKIVVKLKRISSVVSIVGTPVHLVPFNVASSSGLINCSASITTDGTNIKVNVIGVADRTIQWTCNRFPRLEVIETWTAQPAPTDGYVLSWDATNERWKASSAQEVITIAGFAVGGDLSGTLPNPNVVKIQSKTLDTDLATIDSNSDGYVLSWDNADAEWQAKSVDSLRSGSLVGPVISDVTDPINISYVIDSSPDGTRDFFLVVGSAGSGITLTLPAAQQGRTFIIKNTSGGSITIARNNVGDKIENIASDYSMGGGSIMLICSGNNPGTCNWWIASAS